jgi:hypothetical protein
VEAHRVVRRRGSHIFFRHGSQMVVRLSALRAGRPLPPMNIPGTHFCSRLSEPRATVRLGEFSKLKKKKIHLIGTRTRDLPTCTIVPQPTSLLRAPFHYNVGTDTAIPKISLNFSSLRLSTHGITRSLQHGLCYTQTIRQNMFVRVEASIRCHGNHQQP